MPKWDRLTEAQRQQLRSCPIGDLPAVAEKIGISYAVALYNRSKTLAGALPAPTPIFTDWLTIQTPGALIISDPQVPCHDADFINRCWDVGAAWGIQVLVWAGDFYNLDRLSPFHAETPVPSPEDERKAGLEIFCRAGERFSKQYWPMGNHDVRHIKAILALGYAWETAIAMLCPPSVVASMYHFCDIVSNGRKWRIEHPKNCSITPGQVGLDLAAKYVCNVVVAHGHTIGYRRDRSNRYAIIDSGGAFHLDKLAYVSLEHSRRPAMNQGAVLIHEGIATLIDPLNCDFDLLAWAGQRKAK